MARVGLPEVLDAESEASPRLKVANATIHFAVLTNAVHDKPKDSRRVQYSKEKLAEWREAFNIFDANNDGDIGVAELGAVMKVDNPLFHLRVVVLFEAVGKNPTDAQLKGIIAEVDADGSGTIDFDEFCQMMQNQEASMLPDDELRAAFNMCDSDGSGTISAKELLHAMNDILGENMTEADIVAMIKEADSDGSGEIDFEEFKKIMTTLGSK